MALSRHRVLLAFLSVFVVTEASLQIYSLLTIRDSVLLSIYVPYMEFVITRGHASRPGLFEFVNADNLAGTRPPVDAPRVWFFGGSTMEGEDRHWLAVEFAHLCQERGRPCSVRNFGQSAFQLSNEKYLFFELLRRGEKPDIAIFYDGVNDIETDVEKQLTSQSNTTYRAEYHRIYHRNAFRKGLHRRAVKTPFVLDVLLNRTRIHLPEDKDTGLVVGKTDTPVTVVEHYKHNVRLINAVCRHYGIQCYFAWQPELLTKDRRTAVEQEIYERLIRYWKPRQEVHAQVASDEWLRGLPNFRYLGDMFRDEPNQIYTDHCHFLRGSGANRAVAERLFELAFGSGKPGAARQGEP